MVRNKQSYFIEPGNIQPLRSVLLQCFGKLLRPVEDGDHINAIYHYAVNQSIRVDDKFTQFSIIVRGHNASGEGMIDELL